MRNAETKVLTLEKRLLEAQNYVRKLNEQQYEGWVGSRTSQQLTWTFFYLRREFPDDESGAKTRDSAITSRDRRSIRMLTGS